MLLASVGLHVFLLSAVLYMFPGLAPWRVPAEQGVSHVKLVQSKPPPQTMEKAPDEPGPPAVAAEPEGALLSKVEAPLPATPLESVSPTRLASANSDRIPVKTRKRPIKKIEPPPSQREKSQPEPTEKKEDPDAVLEKRLAAIRSDVQSRNKQSGPGPNSTAHTGTSPSRGVGPSQDDQTEQALFQWLEAVKQRINSNWSILPEDRVHAKIASIGVEIADDGKLTQASVEKSSGDNIFDGSAMRAVHRGAPFPAVPADVREKIRNSGGLSLKFTTRGME
jgi:TonB family protein